MKGAGTLADGFTGLMVIDDPLKPEDAYSQARRGAVNNRYSNTLLSRIAKRKETPIVIIQQRLNYVTSLNPLNSGKLSMRQS